MLEVNKLRIQFQGFDLISIDHFSMSPGERVGLVGESGSGKSITAMTLVGLQPPAVQVSGSVRLGGQELIGLSDSLLADIRGNEIGVIFQDPAKALNPMMRVGRQVAEAVRLHGKYPRKAVEARVRELLDRVHLPNAKQMMRRYPHQLSGGQRQRVLIAIAIASSPRLLIADEPTTALDVTVEKEIIELLRQLSMEREMALLFISHDLGVVRAVSESVAVMYGGRIAEIGPVNGVIHHPRHRYTQALIEANPRHTLETSTRLQTIRGSVPSFDKFPSGCRFRGRCPYEVESCSIEPRWSETETGHVFRCWNPVIEIQARAK
jgi:peptide/nickel transport system ATP-binding protein